MCYRVTQYTEHRKALTRLLLSCHALAIERLRWTEHCRPYITRNWRLCRFCKIAVESPEHALLECNGLEALTALRNGFMTRMYTDVAHLPHRPMVSSIDLLRSILAERKTIQLFAKYTYEVLMVFEVEPISRGCHVLNCPYRDG